MRTIPYYRPSIGPDEIDEVVDTLRSGWLTTGPKTKRFESEFAAYLGAKHAVAVNSCTAALHLALDAIDLRAGQTVVVPSMTFAATAEVVRYFNAKPLLVDCRESDFNMDVVDAERRIEAALAKGEEVVAIIPVHYGGQIGDVAGVSKLAGKYGLKVIEDAAHCCPAYYKTSNVEHPTPNLQRPTSNVEDAELVRPGEGWKSVGTEAAISCYSFYANKTITTGEGGMACTNNETYAERMRIMSLHGISKDAWKRFSSEGSWYYEIIAPGFKYNLTDIAASLGIHQLRRADEMHRRRSELAEYYSRQLGDIEELVLPRAEAGRVHSWHLYVIRLRLDRLKIDRAAFIDAMNAAGVGTSVHWMPLHMHPYYANTFAYRPSDLPTAERLYREIVSLPLYPDLGDADVDYVCQVIREIVTKNRRSGY